MTAVPASPFGVSVSSDGRWAFVSLGEGIGVFRPGPAGTARLVRVVRETSPALGNVLAPGGRYLLNTDDGSGAEVVSVSAAEDGGRPAVAGELTSGPANGGGAIEVAVTANGRYAFVTLEDSQAIAVFRFPRALSQGFGPADYVGSVPTQIAPVGLAISPDGRWLYSTSEAEQPPSMMGSLSVISVARAETDPSAAVVARVPAGCSPVRVITSADGDVVWVAARASDALLAFSARALRTDPSHALIADVRVGELPVGLALVRGGSLIVVADSDRFGVSGAHASLAVVDVPDALSGRSALLGYLPAGAFPREMAVVPGGKVLLVSNFGSDRLEGVRLANLP
jgi:DNA-binding beta-propeller fold protein YncE